MNQTAVAITGVVVGLGIFVWWCSASMRRPVGAKNRRIKADKRVIAMLVDQQAKTDMAMLVLQVAIDMHPRAPELKRFIRERAPELLDSYSAVTESPAERYRRSAQSAIDALIGK